MCGMGRWTVNEMTTEDDVEGAAEGKVTMGACGEVVEAMERKKSGS